MTLNPEIKQAVDCIQVIDTHEHLIEESQRLQQQHDFFSLFSQYAANDLTIAGMLKENRDKCEDANTPVDEKWRLFEPHYLAARHTGYMRAIRLTIRDLYGIENLDRNTCATLTERIRARNKPGVLRWVLRDRCNIRICQVHNLGEPFRMHTDADLFLQDLDVSFLMGWPPAVDKLSQITGVSITSFKSYGAAIDRFFEMYAPMADAIKQGCAYWRSLDFTKTTDAEAERLFEAATKNTPHIDSPQRRLLENWTFHRCVQRAIDYNLPVKIHTGYLDGYNSMRIENINPALLTSLLIAYPQARFSLFHIGYPYQAEMIALAKHFTNVYVDMCFAWLIDPLASRQFLKQFLTAIPANKLFAFGGDYLMVEPVYGHLRMTRDGIAQALSELVEEDWFTVNDAVAVAQRILHDNAATTFDIDAKSAALRAAQSQPAK